MAQSIKQVRTRFRGFQLGVPGSSFSYFASDHFTLIEAMATDLSKPRLMAELATCGKATIDTLHITSWDQDHCSVSGLEWILHKLAPSRIETPGYDPHTDNGEKCLEMIDSYRGRWNKLGKKVTTQRIDPPYIKGLSTAQSLEYREIVYHPKEIRESSNDNSTVKFFRSGCFNVLSLGDVEDSAIAAMLKRCTTLCREIDVMILAHHGADNGFTTKNLLEQLSPKIAICSSNFDNEYSHPKPEIRTLLHSLNIPIFTTKTGDLIIESTGGHTMDYRVVNLIADSTEISSVNTYRSRKSKYLLMNQDSVRNVLNPGYRGWKR